MKTVRVDERSGNDNERQGNVQMGKNIPNGRIDRLNWIESLIEQWTANQVLLGLSAPQIADLTQRATDARDAFENANEARLIAKTRTQLFHDKADDAHALASDLLALIKGTAVTSAEPIVVYCAAGITARKKSGPTGAPGQPAIERTSVNADGSITLNFAVTGPASPASPVGTTWQVSRQLDGETVLRIIGLADPATKSFTDQSLPEGTSRVWYQIAGVRGARKGPVSVRIAVRLGNVPVAAAKAAA